MRTAGVSWADLEKAAPELAAKGRELIEDFGFALVGTVRLDGTPRISPVETHIVSGQLTTVMIAETRKAEDIKRDPRVTLQSPVTEAAEPGRELKVRGYVEEAVGALGDAMAVAIESTSGWRPADTWRHLYVAIESAAVIDWTEDGDMLLSRWDTRHGSRRTERRRLDFATGSYRRITP